MQCEELIIQQRRQVRSVSELRKIQPVGKGIPGWISANNELIYQLVTGESAEVSVIDINVRLKLIAQLKLRNKELRMLRINRVTDKLLDKIEVAVDNLMTADLEGDIQFIPLYLNILRSLQESARATSCEVELGDALIFDTIESVAKTGISDLSRDKIRAAAGELLALCTTTSETSPED